MAPITTLDIVARVTYQLPGTVHIALSPTTTSALGGITLIIFLPLDLYIFLGCRTVAEAPSLSSGPFADNKARDCKSRSM